VLLKRTPLYHVLPLTPIDSAVEFQLAVFHRPSLLVSIPMSAMRGKDIIPEHAQNLHRQCSLAKTISHRLLPIFANEWCMHLRALLLSG
jgi:hypothetical protein